jgi:16S rRNA processing protein RimM
MTKEKQKPSQGDFIVGRVIGALGLKGVLKVRLETNNPDLLSAVKTVKVSTASGATSNHRVDSMKYEKRHMLVKLEDIADRTQAEKLLGALITTERQQIRDLDEDEFWMRDLVGLDVYATEGGEKLGTICDIVGESGEFLEMSCADPKKADTVLIPFVRAIVPTVDVKAGRIEIVNLPGLLD